MPAFLMAAAGCGGSAASIRVSGPKEVERIRDRHLRELAKRIQRIPVKFSFSESSIMSSCVKSIEQKLLHSSDSSCLEWAADILGWFFSDLKMLPQSGVAAKREHLYQLWRAHIQRPMVLVGPSLGAATAIDFIVKHPERVSRLGLIDASVYAEGTGMLSKLPRVLAYAGVSLLKSTPLRFYACKLAFKKLALSQSVDWTNAPCYGRIILC